MSDNADTSYLNWIGDDCFRLILQYTQIQTIVTTNLISKRANQVCDQIATKYLPMVTLDLSQADLCQRYSKTRISMNIRKLKLINRGYNDLCLGKKIISLSKYLQVLDLSNNYDDTLVGILISYLISTNVFSQLKILDLGYNFMDAKGMRILAPHLSSLPCLQNLHLHGNYLHTEGIQALSPYLSSLPRLQTLDLDRNSIGVEGMKILSAHLTSLPCLQTLNLRLNRLGSEGMSVLIPHLASTNVCPRLQTLNLSDNQIGDEGMRGLTQCFTSVPQLQILDLSCNKLSDMGIDFLFPHLASIPQLKILDLSYNKLSFVGIERFQTQYPHIEIRF